MHYGITLGRWGIIALHIASEKISSVAGNTEEIFSVLGQLAAYISSEENSAVVGAACFTYCIWGNFSGCLEH